MVINATARDGHGYVELNGCPKAELRMVEDIYLETKGRSSMRTRNIGGIQCELQPKTGECIKPIVVRRNSGGDQQENKNKGHSPQVAICR